jgi:hypothetical protein
VVDCGRRAWQGVDLGGHHISAGSVAASPGVRSESVIYEWEMPCILGTCVV